MSRRNLTRRTLLTGVTTLTALGIAAGCSGGGTNHDGMTGSSTRPSSSAQPSPSFNEADVAFAQMMIPHHEQAVEMAALAETRAGDPEIKQIADAIKAAQDPEIVTMTGWLKAWGYPTAGGHNMPGMSGTDGMPGMASDQELSQLKAATGVDFDRMFARMMIAHHNGAITMCRDLKAAGVNAEAAALASTIEQAQAAEVRKLEAILDRL